MKTPSTELQELIRTLQLGEVNTFRIYCQSRKDLESLEYLKLFNIYLKDEVSDDHQIKKIYKFKNFTRVKNYLHLQLLQFLAEKTSPTIEKEIISHIVSGEVLIKRALYKQGFNLLQKARNLAMKYERFHYCLIIDQKINEVQHLVKSVDYWRYFVEEYTRREFEPLEEKIRIDREMQCYAAKLNIFMLNKDGLVRTEESLKELDKLFLPLMKKPDTYPQSLISKLQYYTLASVYYTRFNRFDLSVVYATKAVELFELYPFFYELRYMNYVISMNNLLICYTSIRDFGKVKDTLLKLQSVPVKDKAHGYAIAEVVWVFETFYFMYNTAESGRRRYLRRTETEVLKYMKRITPVNRVTISMNIAINHFMEGQFKKSLEWINRLDDQGITAEPFKSTYAIMRLFRLILFYEMGKLDLLQYSISNTYRSLHHNKLLFTLEKVVIKTLEKLVGEGSNKKNREIILRNALEVLEPLKNDKTFFHVLSLFNFVGWIKCKLLNRSLLCLMNDSSPNNGLE